MEAGTSQSGPPDGGARGGNRSRGRGRGRRRPRNRSRGGSASSGDSAGCLPDLSALPARGAGRGRGRGGKRRGGANRSTRTASQIKVTVAPSPTELSDRLSSQVARGQVECVVCLDRIRREAPIWHCSVCYTLTHLHCARKWGNQTSETGAPRPTSFNCPGCRAPAGDPRSIQFRCYCGRRKSPQLEPGLLPGSCGDPCLKPRGVKGSGCPHKCTSLCHPGPCAPCVVQAPPMPCYCAKELVFRKCGEEKPTGGVSCGGICGKVREDCGHACERVCHAFGGEGCGDCEAMLDVACFCGGAVTKLPCAVASKGYACGEVCGRMLTCGNHRCESICHLRECPPCATSVEVVTTCACGKVEISDEERRKRTSCSDPLPSCGGLCAKDLGCLQGHKCQDVCAHERNCKPCKENVMVECRCAATVVKTVCGEKAQTLRERLVCDKKCNEGLLCRRHRCQTVCCFFKKRRALPRPNVVPSGKLWVEGTEGAHMQGITNAVRRRLGHGCSETCGKELSCGLHACDLSCGHSGDCPPCGILSREPLFCSCGSVSLPPPVRCGTSLPTCGKPCSQVRICGHQCPLNCHDGECPPCAENIKFQCVGGHGESRFVPCHVGVKGIKCSRACGRALKCGVHACRNACHGDYPRACEPSNVGCCSQPCGLARNKCGHTCTSQCHPGMICPDTPCREMIVVSCPCGRRQEESMCLRGGMGGARESGDAVRLSCDEECTAQSRLRAFASAVGKEGSSSSVDNTGISGTKYTEFLLQFAEREPGMLDYFERELGKIVSGKTKKFVLQDLPQLHRLIVHTLAEKYNLDSESSGRATSKQLVVRHRGVGVKPVYPRPLLSEAVALREREKKRSRQLESGKALVIHVASSTKYPATASIETRVENELRAHAGSYRILEKTIMSSNLNGVSVEFSTSERALLARNSLVARPGVTVETPVQRLEAKIVSAREIAKSVETGSFAALESQSWNEGTEYRERGLRNGLPAPPPAVLVDENVPDSWDD